jgi:hypothetical protein
VIAETMIPEMWVGCRDWRIEKMTV